MGGMACKRPRQEASGGLARFRNLQTPAPSRRAAAASAASVLFTPKTTGK